jgi:CHAT domain-containing protein
LQSYRYVLFGTHAVLTDSVHALAQPSLVLAQPPDSDGLLTMARVFGLSFNAQAILLSACDSGGGAVTSGEGVQGLTQAFMYAGTPVVGVTDWQVVDSVQERLTPAFFAGMAAGKMPAEALRQAKLSLLRSEDPLQNHPFFWAPMVIFGDGDDSAG